MKRLPGLFILFVLLLGCSRPSYQERLQRADLLLREDSLEAARDILEKLSPAQLDRSDYAYYTLLNTQLCYKTDLPCPSDSILEASMEFFRSKGDVDKEVYSLFYLGMIAFSNGDLDKAALWLKHGEKHLDKVADPFLRNKIFSGLVTVNYMSGIDSTAFRYVRRELDEARRAGNNVWTSYAYNHLACLHARAGNTDSAYHYINLIEPLLGQVPPYSKAENLSNMAVYYLAMGDTAKAENYARLSFSTAPNSINSSLMARLRLIRGDTLGALGMWEEAARKAPSMMRSDSGKVWRGRILKCRISVRRLKSTMWYFLSRILSIVETQP